MRYTPFYLDDLMVRMAHHSTAIEGNSLTQGETKSLLIDGYVPRAMDLRELHEVLNYKAFMPFLRDSLESKAPLTLEMIRQIHAILCKDAIESVPGQFKQVPNMIIGASFTPTPPYMVPQALQDWILNLEAQLDAAKDEHTIIEAICRQHVAFERIHPFSDGNGRVGRALIVYSCMMADLPPAVITVERRKEYISYLNSEDLPGLTAFVETLLASERQRLANFPTE